MNKTARRYLEDFVIDKCFKFRSLDYNIEYNDDDTTAKVTLKDMVNGLQKDVYVDLVELELMKESARDSYLDAIISF